MKLEKEVSVALRNKDIPTITFFGTKGGVGKTTFVDKYSTLVSRADIKPNVLIVDFDVHHRGITIIRANDRLGKTKTIHDYLASDMHFDAAIDITKKDYDGPKGRELLIPSAKQAEENVFQSLSKIDPDDLAHRLKDVFVQAIEKYEIDLIIVDCGPIIDPLTATAAHISDKAFIIGQNEPITFRSLENYTLKIRDFFPDFDPGKVRVILNKVRGEIPPQAGIYASVPFTLEVVDFAEGLPNIDEIRLVYLDYCIFRIIKSVFANEHDELIPGIEAILTNKQLKALELVDAYRKSNWYGRNKIRSYLSIVGLIIIVSGFLVFNLKPEITNEQEQLNWLEKLPTWLINGYIVAGGLVLLIGIISWNIIRQANTIIRTRNIGGSAGILELLTTRKGRVKFNMILKIGNKILSKG